jgi:hypothetical protein
MECILRSISALRNFHLREVAKAILELQLVHLNLAHFETEVLL